jgi:hypothetical protein
MMPKVKAPKPPKMPTSALDTKRILPDDSTSTAYNSLISTSPTGLERKADVKKKTLLGGA